MSLAEIDALCGGRPFVMIDVAKGSPLPSVVIDQGHGSALATRHLVDLGHHHVAEISGPLAWHDAWARHEAWRETLLKAGLTPGRSVEGDWTAEGGYRAAEALLSSGERFTALVVGNDQMALGALAALSERGVRVPEEVSVVGFDDVPEARFYRPPLTTVRQDFAELGTRSAALILKAIEARRAPQLPPRPEQVCLTPELVVRLSTAPPPR